MRKFLSGLMHPKGLRALCLGLPDFCRSPSHWALWPGRLCSPLGCRLAGCRNDRRYLRDESKLPARFCHRYRRGLELSAGHVGMLPGVAGFRARKMVGGFVARTKSMITTSHRNQTCKQDSGYGPTSRPEFRINPQPAAIATKINMPNLINN